MSENKATECTPKHGRCWRYCCEDDGYETCAEEYPIDFDTDVEFGIDVDSAVSVGIAAVVGGIIGAIVCKAFHKN